MNAAWDELPATFTTLTARERGLHVRDLYRLRDEGEVVQLSRGVFRKADAPPAAHPDLLAITHRAPVAVVCCVSAAALHDLTDEIPPAVQIAVPRDHRPPHIRFPPVEVFRFAVATFEIGLTAAEVAPGEWVRVYSPERTVVDLMRLRASLGSPLALSALRRYLRSRAARPGAVLDIARALKVLSSVRAVIDVLIAE
ncbi:MAG TPA: type IV toxin-antitoxin system AbiEi family antitoxin [Umezawaea sp.]|nr:type IV toxin-antitoxin system AbiEi family antitoxin [Umezawaea sp.]